MDGILSRQVCRALEAPDLLRNARVANILVSELVVSASFSSFTSRHQTRLLKAVLTAQVRGMSFPALESGLHLHGWDRINKVLSRLAVSSCNCDWGSNVEMLVILARFVLRCRGASHARLAGDVMLAMVPIFPRDRGFSRSAMEAFVRVGAVMYASMPDNMKTGRVFAALYRMTILLREEVDVPLRRVYGLSGEGEDILVCSDGEADIFLLVERSDIVASSSRALLACTDEQWERCQTIDIRFMGESGMGEGVARDWLGELCAELFYRSGLFCGCQEDPAVVHPNCLLQDTPAMREKMDLIGRIMGLCLRLEIPTGAHLSDAAVALITGRSPDQMRDLVQLDPVLARSCAALRSMDPEEEVELGRFMMLGTDNELFPGGALVSVGCLERPAFVEMLETRQIYGSAYACLWIRRGLRHVLCQQMCTDIDGMGPHDFNASFGGQGVGEAVDVADWRRHTEISDGDTHVADMLFSVIREMEPPDRRRFLRFWTGSSSLPHGGFCALSGHLRLVVIELNYQGKLPTSHTCVRTLIMPRHLTSMEIHSAIQLCMVSMDFDDSTP